MDLGKAFKRYGSVVESFVHKTRSKKNTDLISEPSFVLDNGVYILHETLGVRDVDGWNPKFNNGVIGILLIEDDHEIVIALEDSPENLIWSKQWKLVNRAVDELEDDKSDFNGEEYCRNLNSPDFPAAYYCLNYKKGGRDWYLPSSGELWLIGRHIEEIQTALSIVGGQKFVTTLDGDLFPCYWGSTERDVECARYLQLYTGNLGYLGRLRKTVDINVRPISKFQPSELKESFTKKIGKKNVSEIIGKSEEVFDIYLDLKKFVFENNSFKSTEGWYYFDIKNFDSIPVCHEFLDDLEINDYNEYLYTYGNILLKKGKSWKDSKLMVEINKSDSSELYDDVVETVPWEYLSDYQGEQERIVDCLLET